MPTKSQLPQTRALLHCSAFSFKSSQTSSYTHRRTAAVTASILHLARSASLRHTHTLTLTLTHTHTETQTHTSYVSEWCGFCWVKAMQPINHREQRGRQMTEWPRSRTVMRCFISEREGTEGGNGGRERRNMNM